MSNQIYANATQRYADQHEDFTIIMARGAGGDDWTIPMKLRLDGRRVQCTILAGTDGPNAGAVVTAVNSVVVAGNYLPVKYRPTAAASSTIVSMSHAPVLVTQVASSCSLVFQPTGELTLNVLGSAVAKLHSDGSSCTYYLE